MTPSCCALKQVARKKRTSFMAPFSLCGPTNVSCWPERRLRRYAWVMATPTSTEEDPGHELDSVTVFSSQTDDAEMEALAVRGVLEANGIESVVVGSTTIPSLEFQVQVSRDQAEDADRVL